MSDDRTKIQQEHGKKIHKKTSTCQQLQEVKQWNIINQNRTRKKNYTQLSEDSTQNNILDLCISIG